MAGPPAAWRGLVALLVAAVAVPRACAYHQGCKLYGTPQRVAHVVVRTEAELRAALVDATWLGDSQQHASSNVSAATGDTPFTALVVRVARDVSLTGAVTEPDAKATKPNTTEHVSWLMNALVRRGVHNVTITGVAEDGLTPDRNRTVAITTSLAHEGTDRVLVDCGAVFKFENVTLLASDPMALQPLLLIEPNEFVGLLQVDGVILGLECHTHQDVLVFGEIVRLIDNENADLQRHQRAVYVYGGYETEEERVDAMIEAYTLDGIWIDGIPNDVSYRQVFTVDRTVVRCFDMARDDGYGSDASDVSAAWIAAAATAAAVAAAAGVGFMRRWHRRRQTGTAVVVVRQRSRNGDEEHGEVESQGSSFANASELMGKLDVPLPPLPSEDDAEELLRLVQEREAIMEALLAGARDAREFDSFAFARMADGRPLALAGMRIMERRGLIDRFSMDRRVLARWLLAVEATYEERNPYHNATHATDVLQTLNAVLDVAHDRLAPLDELAAVIAALMNDAAHPGVNNMHLVSSGHIAARLYNDQSVSENFAAAIGWRLLDTPELDALAQLTSAERFAVRRQSVALVLSTDMERHTNILARLRQLAARGVHEVGLEERTQLLLMLAMKVADLGHLSRGREVHARWVDALHDELLLQGDRDRAEGRKVAPIMDRYQPPSVRDTQLSFIDHVGLPLFRLLPPLLGVDAIPFLAAAEDNFADWDCRTARSSVPVATAA